MILAFLLWLAHVSGVDNVSGPFYGFWSGIGSDVGEVTVILAAVSFWWRHTCHVKGCYRVGRHGVQGTSFVVCRKHHPEGEPSQAEVVAQHRAAKASRASN